MHNTSNVDRTNPKTREAESGSEVNGRAVGKIGATSTKSTAPAGKIGWYKDAVIYELHVRAFADSNGDGVGDFAGLTEKLDYLQDLGVTAVWLLPFYPSPLQDDGYDIADYRGVHPTYGTIGDFKIFMDEAHRRGLRVITELVLNHTSDQHRWFQLARRAAPGSPERDFYVWSDSPDRYAEARIIFKDYETSNWRWDPVANAYYWHRFYSHQPDLNYESPMVRQAMFDVVDYWLGMGVDGLRLDAVPYLYEQEGTTCENLPQTHAFLRELRAHVDEHFPDRMLLAEANQWPEEAVSYFGEGDECHMAFHFPLMPRLFMSIRTEDRFPIVDILAQTPEIPASAQWALFLRNHDELTLEMVTDEERLYMYRVYADRPEARINLGIRRRLAPLLRNDRRRIELMNALLFSLPGTPVLYYGDEIGMGDNIYLGDRNSVRTPMQWNADRNAGFSRANPQQLYLPLITDHEYHHESVQVEAQQNNPHSLFQWTRRLVALRKRYHAFGRGAIEFLHPENRKVLVFTRTFEDEVLLVIANLSRFAQPVELDLSVYEGTVPVELFGRVEFPPIGKLPYFLTLGPHAFYWFALRSVEAEEASEQGAQGQYSTARKEIPLVTVTGSWESLLLGHSRDALADVLPDYLCSSRWFSGHPYRMLSAQIARAIPVHTEGGDVFVSLVRVDYAHHDPETYVLPLAFASGEKARTLQEQYPHAVVARIGRYIEAEIDEASEDGVLYDGMWDGALVRALADIILEGAQSSGAAGIYAVKVNGSTGEASGDVGVPLDHIHLLAGDLNNTSVVVGDKLVLKLFRAVDTGPNPEVEIGDYLTRRGFKHIAPLAGSLWHRQPDGSQMALASLEHFVPNLGSGWDLAQSALQLYVEQVERLHEQAPDASLAAESLLRLASEEATGRARTLVGEFLPAVRLLGQRTAELHTALALETDNPAFRPVAFTSYSQRSLYQSVRRRFLEVVYSLRHRTADASGLSTAMQSGAQAIISSEQEVLERLERLLNGKLSAVAARHHGDLRLSQVLCAAGDFVFIDFEGEPHRIMAERRLKQSPLYDVATMIGSLHSAAWYALWGETQPDAGSELQGAQGRGSGRRTDERAEQLGRWLGYWVEQSSAEFLRAYIGGAAPEAGYLPAERYEALVLLDTMLLQHFLTRLDHALHARTLWAEAALAGVLHVLAVKGPAPAG